MISQIKNNILFENGKIFDPFSNHYIEGSILIKNGKIEKVGIFNSPQDSLIVNCEGKILTSGFIDIHSHFREPGREDKETLITGAQAAFSGGFTRVCVMPNTEPPLDNPESIQFIIEQAKDLPVKIFPIGAITKGQKGNELTEFGQMVEAGIVAISDDGIPVQNGQLMRYAVEYAKQFNIPVINHAEDIFLRNDGVMNEGSVSTQLGLTGNPDIAESVMIHRDLEIVEYTNGKIHIPHVSTARSVDLIRQYKKKGINVTAEVTPHHLALSENHLLSYDSNAKVAPPLRNDKDREELIKGLLDGTIDCIATDHAPHTQEEKEMDIINTPCGMIALESAFGLSNKILVKAGISTEQVIRWFTSGPAKVMGWNLEPFKVGSKVEMCIIDPDLEWEFSYSDIFSKSKNSPIVGTTLLGKVISTFHGNLVFGGSRLNLD